MFMHSLKLLVLSVCVMFSVHGALAASLGENQARRIAADFFAAGGCERLSNESALGLAQTSVNSAGECAYYVFNAKDGQGFIIVSANDNIEPVIAYAYDGSFEGNSVPEATASVLLNVKKHIASAKVASPRRKTAATTAAVSGNKLLNTATWSQEAPFNNLIPNRRLTGCVGVAMAIIMRHHAYPEKGKGSIGNVNFDATYDWTNMRTDNYRNGYTAVQAQAVATLVSHAAQSILTDFGMSSSSAFEVRVPSALINHFGYDPGVSYKKRAEMDKASWDALIASEIEAGRPVLYSGQDVSVGHAFVCDGYETRGSETYFHINWGWGGTANAYFASDALNPSVSRDYHFNDQTTIVYNIKPAAMAGAWSPIHLTSDGSQIGMTSDITDMSAGTSFTVRAGALKNISNDNFTGSIAIAIYDGAGAFKSLVSDPRGFNLPSLQINQYTDFTCNVPAASNVVKGDVVRLVTKANGTDNWLPVAGDLLVAGEIPAIGNEIPYFAVQMPTAVEGAVISAPTGNKVIKGRDFSFNVTSQSSDKVITVKANGFILTPNTAGNYVIRNVNSDQKVSVTVQNAADVISKRNVWVTAGNLSNLINDTDAGTIKDLTIYGTIDATDFTFIRERMKLTRLDISSARILANGSNPANAIPAKAFYWYGSLQEVVLPSNLTTLKSGCFTGTGLKSVEIPASVGTWEYNVFLGCESLREVISRRTSPAWINWCVFNGSPRTKLIVPVGSKAAYSAKEYWKDFKEIIEQNPVPASSYSIDIQEIPGVKITAETEDTEVAPGSSYKFKVETDDSFGDATMEVYANSTRLNADASGYYTAVINSNTLLHTNFKYPEAVSDRPSTWKITGANNGAGLVTDVINVAPGKTFSMRVNALAIPANDAAMFYAAVLTDSKGAIKEFISPVITNSSDNHGNLPCTFSCQVKEASVREGNLIRIVTSYNKKNWYLVDAESETVCDRLKAVGNEVKYHNVTMPESIEGATITGNVTQVVHGMPLNITVVPVSENDLVTISVNDVVKIADAATAKLSIGSVMEDLNISIQVNPKGTQVYTVVHVHEGELETKIASAPARLKVVGTINQSEFAAFKKHITKIKALDLADLTIINDGKEIPELPELAFYDDKNYFNRSALESIILPSNLKRIETQAFYRNLKLKEITLPASIEYIGNSAFDYCLELQKIIVLRPTPCELGNMGVFPTTKTITIEVPKGSLAAYQAPTTQSYWKEQNLVESAIFFNVQVDQKRVVNVDPTNVQLSKIAYPETATSVELGLPNSEKQLNPSQELYPGKAFRLYDNGVDVTETASSIKEGKYNVTFDPAITDEANLAYPQNHKVDVVLFHTVAFNKSSDKISVDMIVTNEENIWQNVAMSIFDSSSSEVRPAVYKEHGNYGFKVMSEVPGMEPKVKITDHSGEAQTVIPDEEGVYMISDLQGDVTVDITMVPTEGAILKSDELAAVDKESAADITSIGMSGNVSSEDFETIRENFSNLETLNLSDMENTSIPANAFTGMSNLSSVVIPDNVTEIGENAFSGCSNLESISLSSVDQIGAGAFNGCSNLTSISISGNGTQGTRSFASRAAGINDDSFKGINPNCLIFVQDQGLSLSGNNVIYNSNGMRQAMTDINISTEYPFSTPGSFNLGDNTISLKATAGYKTGNGENWSGIVLPFVPTSVMADGKAVAFAEKGDATMRIMTFADANAETLTDASVIEPNTPYVIRLNDKGTGTADVVFSATGKSTGASVASDDLTTADFDVQTTPAPEAIVRTGKDFSIFASYTNRPYAAGDYTLNEAGSMFVLTDGTEAGSVAPFSAYMRANNGSAPESFAIGGNDETSSINTVIGTENGNISIYRDGSVLVITAVTEGSVNIYNLQGNIVRTVTLSEGRNTIELPAGIYILEGIKVMM